MPLPQRFLHRCYLVLHLSHIQSHLFSLKSSSSFLLLLRRPYVTSTLPSIFPSVTCCGWQLLHKIWSPQLAFLLFIVCRIFLSFLTPFNNSFLTRSYQLYFSKSFSQDLSNETLIHIYCILQWSYIPSVTKCLWFHYALSIMWSHCHDWGWMPTPLSSLSHFDPIIQTHVIMHVLLGS
jgi:hypothetical protein